MLYVFLRFTDSDYPLALVSSNSSNIMLNRIDETLYFQLSDFDSGYFDSVVSAYRSFTLSK